MNNIIEAAILNERFKGEDVLLPRIPMIPSDMSFELKRLQFPVRLAFVMTINKAPNPFFSHGQLYVAWSCVGKPSDLLVYTPAEKKQKILYNQKLFNKHN
jgi:ATP-dependent DNA helicase PIF1